MIHETLQVSPAILTLAALALVSGLLAVLLRVILRAHAAKIRKVHQAELDAYDAVIKIASRDANVMLNVISEVSRERDTAIKWLSEEYQKNEGN